MESYHGYELIQEIGRGAYGIVHLARKGGSYVALKRVVCTDVHGANECRRERRGIETLRRLPPVEGMIRVLDCGDDEDGKSFFYVMELADDERGDAPDSGQYRPRTLASVVAAEIALSLPECVAIGVRLAGALTRLQAAHIVHRDIKPGNVLFVRGKAVLADPGLVADVREASSIVGTPGWVPPERQGSARGDVYELGLTLYRASTGRPPEELGLPPCPEANYDHPWFWKWMTILAKATAKVPSDRYGGAKGFLRDLRALEAAISPRRRFWRRLAIVAVAAVFLVGAVIPALWNYGTFRDWMDDEVLTYWPINDLGDVIPRLRNGPDHRYHTPLPYPYTFLRRFYAPKEDPCNARKKSK